MLQILGWGCTSLKEMRTELRVVTEDSLKYLEYCIGLGQKFENPPSVILELHPQTPQGQENVGVTDISSTVSFQCYAKGISPMRKRPEDKAADVNRTTLDAGHHTTRMHANFTWKLVGVSRNVTHDVFHSYPFYNSEQQSQRYVEIKDGSYLVPATLTENQRLVYLQAARYANDSYFELLRLLGSEVRGRIVKMYPESGWRVGKTAERLEVKIGKLSQEVARYVAPVGQLTVYDHTLNELQLLRLFRASTLPNFSDEARFVIAEMIRTVAEVDPTILSELRAPLSEVESGGFYEEYVLQHKREFDALLGDRQSVIRGDLMGANVVLASAVRNVLGLPEVIMSQKDALDLLVNPALNPLLADVYESGMMDPLTSCLRQASVTFSSKLSHAGDSQRQRHRRTPGATPPIEATYDGNPDYITPLVIRENNGLKGKYNEIIEKMYDNVDSALKSGIPKNLALLLLPNAHAIRVTESGDIFDWLHRWKQRLCFLAQEEIFFASVEQVEQLAAVFPETRQMLLAPCGVRQSAGVRPRCPEGEKWCGRPVYGWTIERYKKERLI